MTIFHSNRYPLACLLCCHLMAALTLTACKDDDDSDSLTPEEQAEKTAAEQQDKAAKFWNVVDQLAGTTETPDDYEGLTLEPTIGEAVSGNETARRVITADLEAAVLRYENLAGLPEGTLTTETPSYTWSDPDVGSLTYTKSTDGRSLATVGVSIRQLPALRQIVYLTEEQAGTNAGNPTNSYYHFGDVISRTRPEDNVTEYWVCVRPSFEPQGKKTSHWVSLSPLPKDKLMEYTSSNKVEYKLPKNLGENAEHMKNLAEMTYAMLSPEVWEGNITYNPGLSMFHDLKHEYIRYVSSDFWQRVANGWNETKTNGGSDLWSTVFGMSRDDMETAIVKDNTGLHLICKSASWSTWISNSPSIPEYIYKNGQGKEANMHQKTTKAYSTQVVFKKEPEKDIELNFVKQYTEKAPGIVSDKFFKDSYRHYVIRHATGDELAKMTNSKYDTKAPIANFKEVFCYTSRYGLDVNKTIEDRTAIQSDPRNGLPAHASADVKDCYLLAENGYYYAHVDSCKADDTKAVAIVVGTQTKAFPEMEQHTDFKYLLMSLSYVEDDAKESLFRFGPAAACITEVKPNKYSKTFDGLEMTDALQGGCGKEHDHAVAKAAWNCTLGISNQRRQALSLSHGFLPSSGQICIMLNTAACGWSDESGFGTEYFDNYMSRFVVTSGLTDTGDGKTNGLKDEDFNFKRITTSTQRADDTLLVLEFGDDVDRVMFAPIGKRDLSFWCVPFFLAK